MPRTVDDIELDSVPDGKIASRSLNTKASTNLKIDSVDDDVKDNQQNNRKDDDGGHRRDDSGKPANNPDSVFYKNRTEDTSSNESEDTGIADFARDLFGDTKEDEEEIKSGGGQTGGSNQDTQDRQPTDEELDSDRQEETPPSSTSGSDRSGQFGAATGGNEGPTFIAEGRNRSKGLYIEYKGVKYTIDRKGTTDELDAGSQAWQDDTVTVGTTVISLKDYFEKSDEEREKMFSNAVGGSSSDVPVTPPATKKFTVKGIFWVVKRDSKYGAIVEVGFDNNGTRVNATFDDTGHIEILGVKYSAKEVFIDGDGSYVVAWLKKQVDDTKSEELAALYAGWGFTPDTPPAETPTDENPSTNPVDPEQKFEAKPKASESPQGAPQNVENSAALTTAKLRELGGKIIDPGPSMNMWDSKDGYKTAKEVAIGTKGYHGLRDQKQKTNGLGFPNKELDLTTKLIGSVKKFFDAEWSNLITGAPVKVAKNPKDLNLIDYPIIMNFPEVGIWNKKIPFVADTQTEQHRMLYKDFRTTHNMDNWGIGTYGYAAPNAKKGTVEKGGFANFAEQPHWCGIFTEHCITHGGYIPWTSTGGLAGANNINNAFFKRSVQILQQSGSESEFALASVPTYTDTNGSITINPELFTKNWYTEDKKGNRTYSFGSGEGYDYKTRMYKLLIEGAVYEEKTETEIVMAPSGDGSKVKPTKKTKTTRERIPVAIRESFLPNPIMAYFIKGIHFTNDAMTPQGKKLLEHLLSQRGWETAIISRGGHIEVCPYVNPDGTIARFGGNTSSTVVTRDGGKFAAKNNSIWGFAKQAPTGGYVVFTRLKPTSEYQKIDPTLNGQFRRTEIVDNYYRSINNKTILPTLKNVLYDIIVEKE